VKLLHVIASVNPKGGGPMEGVRQRGLRLQDLGHSVEVATLDDPAAPWVAAYGLPVHAQGPGRGGYGYAPRLLHWLHSHAKRYDAVVVNGIWQYHSWAAWRALKPLGVPYHVFTHGMLDPWFKKAYPLKHAKKWLYWPWADYRVLRDAQAVLFTSEEERQLARQSFWLYRANEKVVAYGTRTPPQDGERLREVFLQAHPTLRGKRLLLYLSRIHPKKGCDLLVQAFAQAAAQDERLHLVMAGPDEGGWLPRLQDMASQAGMAQRISWPGMLQGDSKWGAFHAAEAFVLPSHQENFGIAVAEALGCGLPVLISDKVNIWREIAADGAGLVAPDTAEGTSDLLRQWVQLDGTAVAAMRQRAGRCFASRFTVDAMATSLLEATSSVTSPHGQPHSSRR
jgi:glycosyltransferase involved in cell wall biosynthesis